MKTIVLYSTRSGNTEKVAQAIASELNCPIFKITGSFDSSKINLDNYDLAFVGTGIYKGQPSSDMLNYLNGLTMQTRRKFALFITCFGWGKNIVDKNVIDTIGAALEAKGQKMLSNRFSFFGGGLGFVKRGHPDAVELAAAKKWARETVREV